MHDFPSQLFQFSTDHPHHYPIMAGIQPIRGFLKIDLQEGGDSGGEHEHHQQPMDSFFISA